MTQIAYSSAGVTIDDLNSHLDELWIELQTPGSWLRRQAEGVLQSQGEDPSKALKAIDSMARSEAVTIKRVGAGIDPATTAVIVAFAPIAAKVVSDVWTLLFNRIKKKFGDDSLQKQEK